MYRLDRTVTCLHSLFFAILIEDEIMDRTAGLAVDLRRRRALRGRLRPTATLHVSLLSLWVKMAWPPPEDVILHARLAASSVTARPFKVCFNRVESLRQTRPSWPLVLAGEEGVIGIEQLHRSLAQSLGQKAQAGFRPHMTLLWSPDHIEPAYVDPITWTVREFSLVHSLVGLGQYDILERFPLND